MEADNNLDSDGYRVNVGNFDADGLNVNNNSDGNRNDNLGMASARKSPFYPQSSPSPESFCCHSLLDLIQPPSILPISSTSTSSATSFLLSIAFVSFMSRIKIRKKISLTLAFSRVGTFSPLCIWLARRTLSSTSSKQFSHRC